MKSPKATMTQGEIPRLVKDRESGEMLPNPHYPADGWCKSGHNAPYGTRFFSVTGEVVPRGREGVYCEFCLIIANHISRLSKQGLAVNFDPQKELERLITETGRSS